MAMMPCPGRGRSHRAALVAEMREENPRRVSPAAASDEEIVLARVQLAQSRVEIPAHVLERGLRKQRAQLCDAPHAAGADAPGAHSIGDALQILGSDPRTGTGVRPQHAQHEGISGVFTLQHGADLQPIGQHCRHVLAAVHREIDLAVQQRVLDFLDEQALAPDFRERTLLQAIARCLDDDDLACGAAG